MKYGNRSFWKSITASPFAMIAAAIILAIFAKSGWNIYEKASVSSEHLIQTQAEFAKLKARQIDLSTRVGSLSTEQGLDTEIRTKYHAVKEGESVAVIVDESKTAVATNASETQATSSLNWWRRMLQVFGF